MRIQRMGLVEHTGGAATDSPRDDRRRPPLRHAMGQPRRVEMARGALFIAWLKATLVVYSTMEVRSEQVPNCAREFHHMYAYPNR